MFVIFCQDETKCQPWHNFTVTSCFKPALGTCSHTPWWRRRLKLLGARVERKYSSGSKSVIFFISVSTPHTTPHPPPPPHFSYVTPVIIIIFHLLHFQKRCSILKSKTQNCVKRYKFCESHIMRWLLIFIYLLCSTFVENCISVSWWLHFVVGQLCTLTYLILCYKYMSIACNMSWLNVILVINN